MRSWEARLNHFALAATAVSGFVYGALKYFVPPQSPDSRLAVPWQPWVLAAHVVAAPLVVFGLGLAFRRHALTRLESGERRGRRTGLYILGMAAPVVFSGYAIQAFAATDSARLIGWLHAGVGALFAMVWFGHALKKRVSS